MGPKTKIFINIFIFSSSDSSKQMEVLIRMRIFFNNYICPFHYSALMDKVKIIRTSHFNNLFALHILEISEKKSMKCLWIHQMEPSWCEMHQTRMENIPWLYGKEALTNWLRSFRKMANMAFQSHLNLILSQSWSIIITPHPWHSTTVCWISNCFTQCHEKER